MDVRQKGLNLLEVMISLAVVGVLASIALPSFRHMITNKALVGAAEQFYQQLALARSEALKEAKTIYVTVKGGSSWCYGISDANTCDCDVPSTCPLGTRNSAESSNVSLATTGFPAGTLTFEGSRGAPSGTAQADFTSDGKTVRVDVNQLGTLSICSNSNLGLDACS